MSRIVRSSKGELVNFDLITIKDQMSSAVQPTLVQERQEFIENRLHRKAMAKAGLVDITPTTTPEPTPELATIDVTEEPTIKQKAKKQ
jgi:hypothetical protein